MQGTNLVNRNTPLAALVGNIPQPGVETKDIAAYNQQLERFGTILEASATLDSAGGNVRQATARNGIEGSRIYCDSPVSNDLHPVLSSIRNHPTPFDNRICQYLDRIDIIVNSAPFIIRMHLLC